MPNVPPLMSTVSSNGITRPDGLTKEPATSPASEMPASFVAEGLMLSNLPFEREHVEALAGEGIDLVVNMCEDSEYRDGQRQAVVGAYDATGIEEDRACQVKDLGAHPLELLDSATALIEQANGAGRNVVVHCRGGIERSATVTAAVLVQRHGLSVDEALAQLRAIAPQARPLSHQRKALEQWAETR